MAREALFFSFPADYFPLAPPYPFLISPPSPTSPLDAGHLLWGSFLDGCLPGICCCWIASTARGMGRRTSRVSIWNGDLVNCAEKQLSHTSLYFSLWDLVDGGR